jgi:hypothetical protein
MTQTCRQTAGLDRGWCNRERARPSRCASDSDAATPHPGAAPNPIRRGRRDSETAHYVKELRGRTQLIHSSRARAKAWPTSGDAPPSTARNTAPKALQNSSSWRCRWGHPVVAPVGSVPFDIAWPLPWSPSGLRTFGQPFPKTRQISRRGRPRCNAGEELGLGIHQLGGVRFERLCDLCVQSLARAAQQAVMGRILHQRMLEAVDRFGRCDRCRAQSPTPSSAAAQRAPKLPHPFRRTPSPRRWPGRCANASRSAGLYPLHFDKSAIADGAIRAGLSRRHQPELLQVRQWTRQSPPQPVMFRYQTYPDPPGGQARLAGCGKKPRMWQDIGVQ